MNCCCPHVNEEVVPPLWMQDSKHVQMRLSSTSCCFLLLTFLRHAVLPFRLGLTLNKGQVTTPGEMYVCQSHCEHHVSSDIQKRITTWMEPGCSGLCRPLNWWKKNLQTGRDDYFQFPSFHFNRVFQISSIFSAPVTLSYEP